MRSATFGSQSSGLHRHQRWQAKTGAVDIGLTVEELEVGS